MAKVDVLNWDRKKVGEVELSPVVFEAPVRKDVLHSVVRWQMAARRAGTHSTKTRSEVRGGGKKPFKQKGTGNARQGSTRSPLNPGGAVLFGPSPRSYVHSLPKKVRQLGLKSALSHLLKEGRLFVIENLQSENGKTKDLSSKLKKFGLEKAVLVDAGVNETFKRASNNLPRFKYYGVDGINVYDLLKYDNAVITKECLAGIAKRCGLEQ